MTHLYFTQPPWTFVSIPHQWIMAKYFGGAMAITVLFRTTISDLLCPDCSAWAHVVLVTVSCCPILRSESGDKTHLHHLQTGQLAAFRKSDIELFLRRKRCIKGLSRIIKCDCWRVYLKWRQSAGPACWRQEDHFTGDAGCNSRNGSG